MSHKAGVYIRFLYYHESTKSSYTTPKWDASFHRRVMPSTRFAGSHFHTRVERGTGLRTQQYDPGQDSKPGRPGVQRANHEATAPPQRDLMLFYLVLYFAFSKANRST